MSVTPKEREGVRRFIADYQSSTCYRIWVQVKGTWEPCSWLPTYPTMTEAALVAARFAAPTEVRAEKGADGESGRDAASGRTTALPHGQTADMAVAPLPPVLFCHCGHPEDEHYVGTLCTKIEGEDYCGCQNFVREKPLCDICDNKAPLNSDGTPRYPTCDGSAVGLCVECARDSVSL